LGLKDVNRPPLELQRIASCEKKDVNFVTGETYERECKEKNFNGQCSDFLYENQI
jgi:hypothetical protein